MGQPHLLVIDDDPQLLRVYLRMLGSHFAITCAHDVRSALAAIDARLESGLAPFDVVLCDLHLGTCSAKDLYAELQRRSDDLHRHFVVITGAVTSPDDPFAATLGDRYVSKTAPIVALRETLLRNVPPRSAAAAA